jgi:hypothetical protein
MFQNDREIQSIVMKVVAARKQATKCFFKRANVNHVTERTRRLCGCGRKLDTFHLPTTLSHMVQITAGCTANFEHAPKW